MKFHEYLEIQRILGILLTFFVCGSTVAQDGSIEPRHGTILLFEKTTAKIMIVSESRTYDATTEAKGKACKIIELSEDTLFFYTGNLLEAYNRRTGKIIFSQQNLARQAFGGLKMRPRTYNRLSRIASRYSELARPRLEALSKSIRDPSTMIGLAGFASLDEHKHPRLVLVNIPFVVPNDGAPPYTGMPSIYEPKQNETQMGAYKQYAGVSEFFDGKSERAKKAAAEFNSRSAKLPKQDIEVYELIAAVEASLSWNKDDPTIGPPVDAVVVESGKGIRWIKRKPECDGRPAQ
jgi:hypothetical protein